MNWQVQIGDCLEVMRGMERESIDALVADPPAGISFMGKEWDSNKGSRNAWIAWLTEVMEEALRVMKPGAHGLVWALPRTSHWTAMALEDAGFEVRDRVTHIHGQGFPKSANVSKHIDKLAGAEREVIGPRVRVDGKAPGKVGGGKHGRYNDFGDLPTTTTAPATEAAREWDGWGTALKPAVEDWWWVQKPFNSVPESARIAANTAILVEALLWWIAPARFVELSSRSSQSASRTDGECGSVRWLAAVLTTLRSGDSSEVMATFKSPEAARTFLSIVLSWSAILDALSSEQSTSTTETATRLTTALKTLNSLILATIPESIIQVACPQGGLWSNAESAEGTSSDSAHGWSYIPKPSVADSVTTPIAHAIASTLASAVDEHFMPRPASNGNSAEPSATTPTDANGQPRPATEDWWLVRKPLKESSVARQVLSNGCGALNVDGCRVGLNGEKPPNGSGHFASGSDKYAQDAYTKTQMTNGAKETPQTGRFPANLILSHTSECRPTGEMKRVKPGNAGGYVTRDSTKGMWGVHSGNGHVDPDGTEEVEAWVCAEGCPVRLMDEMSGQLHPPGTNGHRSRKDVERSDNCFGDYGTTQQGRTYSDKGGASRFFQQFPGEATLDTHPGFIYKSKASRAERNKGLEGMPEMPRADVMSMNSHNHEGGIDGRGKPYKIEPVQNNHPTVKSLALMRYLTRLITPPGGTVLDPFCGSGSTGCGAVQEGFSFIGIEMDGEYAEIARRRIACWSQPEEPKNGKVPELPTPREAKLDTLF